MEEFLEMILIPEAEIQQDLQSKHNDVAFVFKNQSSPRKYVGLHSKLRTSSSSLKLFEMINQCVLTLHAFRCRLRPKLHDHKVPAFGARRI